MTCPPGGHAAIVRGSQELEGDARRLGLLFQGGRVGKARLPPLRIGRGARDDPDVRLEALVCARVAPVHRAEPFNLRAAFCGLAPRQPSVVFCWMVFARLGHPHPYSCHIKDVDA